MCLGFISSSSNFSLGSLVGGQMFSTSSSNFRSLHHGDRSDERDSGGDLGGHGKTQRGGSWGYWDVGSSHSEPVNIVSGVVNSLDHVVGIDVLVTSSGHTEGVLSLGPGGVDVLVAEAELAQLVLGVELTGWRNDRSWDHWGWDGGSQRKRGRDRGSEGERGRDGLGRESERGGGDLGSRGQDRLGREEGGRDGHGPGDINTEVLVDDVGGGDGVEGVEGCGDEVGDGDEGWGRLGDNYWSCRYSIPGVKG